MESAKQNFYRAAGRTHEPALINPTELASISVNLSKARASSELGFRAAVDWNELDVCQETEGL
jgi:hypothetical protein